MKRLKRSREPGGGWTSTAGQLECLPDDVLADVLGRLPPRSLAASRCVCRLWHDVVDANRLLRADLLPLTAGGIVVNLNSIKLSRFIHHPKIYDTVACNIDYLYDKLDSVNSGKLGRPIRFSLQVKDHCNGLLLIYHHDMVINPATRRWACLPQCPPLHHSMPSRFFYSDKYLAFDPIVSPHYEVFSIPRVAFVPCTRDPAQQDPRFRLNPAIETSEWPPSTCIMHVFSSMTGRWEEKSFVREGKAMGTIADMRADSRYRQRYAVYSGGALYVNCETNLIMRISVSDGTYRVVKSPLAWPEQVYRNVYLGRSKGGVYCVSVSYGLLRVWFLSELHGQINWVLKHQRYLTSMVPRLKYDQQSEESWIFQHVDSNKKDVIIYDGDGASLADENRVFARCGYEEDNRANYFTFIGFHPIEEVVFFADTFRRGFAYNLNNSEIRDLGNLCPQFYERDTSLPFLLSSFLYTPCWIGKFPENC